MSSNPYPNSFIKVCNQYLHYNHILSHNNRGQGEGGEDAFGLVQLKLGFANVVLIGIHHDWDFLWLKDSKEPAERSGGAEPAFDLILILAFQNQGCFLSVNDIYRVFIFSMGLLGVLGSNSTNLFCLLITFTSYLF